jgi:catechol 2,3-dioxygenase
VAKKVAKKKAVKREKAHTTKRAGAATRAKAATRKNGIKNGIKIPIFHHALLKTARFQEMIDWYAAVVGIEPVFQAPGIAFLSNDSANHRISLAGGPQFRDNPQFRTYAGMHHLAFEYASVDDLLDSWRRLHDDYGYEPHVAVHHGMTLSFYYVDPDGNSVELQADVFGDWKKSKKWMSTSAEFRADPIGKFVAPAKMVAARSAGVRQKELLRRAYAGEYAPETPYDFRVDF